MSAAAGPSGHQSDAAIIWPTFDRPAWLLLIPPLCLAAWWIARSSLAGWTASRQLLHLAIRCLVLALLCVALAEPRARWKGDDVAVIAVLDVSDSVPADQQRLGVQFLRASLDKRPPQGRLGVVTAARDPFVQTLPTAGLPRLDIGDFGPTDASDLRRAVDLARAVVPADAAGRVLLISDGNPTSAPLTDIAGSLAAAGVPIDVAAVGYDRSALVRIDDIAVPAWVRDGDTIACRIVMHAGRPASGRLTLLLNGEPVDLDPDSPSLAARVDLPPGPTVLSQSIRLPSGPVHRIAAVFEPDDPAASIPQLLRAEGVTFTSDQGRVLILAEDPPQAAPLLAALTADNIKADLRPAADAPRTLAEWSGFDAVVLFNQPASNFSQAQQHSMVRFVHDAGGGLLVIGGPDSYGAGGWIGSPLAAAMPVLLDPPQKRQMPMGALAIIIDRSGSMGAPVGTSGLTQQQIANEAAILGVRALASLDQVAVIAFDDQAQTVVPLTRVRDPQDIARRIRAIGPGGGTNLFPALDAAAAELAKSPAGVKHVIVLTDGQTVGDPQQGLARAAELHRRGITLSAVAIGDQSNDPLLAGLARTAAGRLYNVNSAAANALLPQIFIKEAQTVRRTLIWEGPPFSPTLAAHADSLRGLPSPLPAITGYVVTADRGGLAVVTLRGPEGDPILAHWQHGLGRVMAFTSDAAARWNAAWTSSAAFGSFWQQQLKWVMRPSSDAASRVTIDTRDDRATVSLELFGPDGDRLDLATVRARLVPPPGAQPGPDPSRQVTFRQTGPGRFQAELDALAVGSHLLAIRYDAAADDAVGQRPMSGSVRAAIIRRAADEFREPVPNTNLLTELATRTNGRIYRLDPAGADLWAREHARMPEISRTAWLLVAIAAIALFLFDVAARRVTLDLQRLRALFASTPQTASASMATLAAAKSRAAATIAEHTHPSSHSAATTPAETTRASTLPTAPASPTPTPPPAPAEPEPRGQDLMSRLQAAKKRSLPPGGPTP
jgi:uncharacterized membrane protein